MNLDLTVAVLIDLDLSRCRVNDAAFTRAKFSGAVGFAGTEFGRNAWFDGAKFGGIAEFHRAKFGEGLLTGLTDDTPAG